MTAKLSSIFEPRYPRRYLGKHRMGRIRYVGTARVPAPGFHVRPTPPVS